MVRSVQEVPTAHQEAVLCCAGAQRWHRDQRGVGCPPWRPPKATRMWCRAAVLDGPTGAGWDQQDPECLQPPPTWDSARGDHAQCAIPNCPPTLVPTPCGKAPQLPALGPAAFPKDWLIPSHAPRAAGWSLSPTMTHLRAAFAIPSKCAAQRLRCLLNNYSSQQSK